MINEYLLLKILYLIYVNILFKNNNKIIQLISNFYHIEYKIIKCILK